MNSKDTMDETIRLEQLLIESLRLGIHDTVFPGGVSCLLFKDGKAIVASAGTLNDKPSGESELPAVTPETLYDAASLTKVVVTLPLILLAVQYAKLELDSYVSAIIPELDQEPDRAWKRRITVRHLLSHTSGLPAWRPFFVRLKGQDDYLQHIGQEPLEHEPGQSVIYSDLGFMLLGCIAERVWGEPLDRLAKRLLFDPLQMNRAAFRPLETTATPLSAIAPTELGNQCEYGMALSHIRAYTQGQLREGAFDLKESDMNALAWRKTAIRGEVHDANAFYGLGGVSGHAGLFVTVADLCRYAAIWLHPSMLSAALCREAMKPAAGMQDGLYRGLGWIVDTDGSFGHTGFTGTSMWYDRDTETMLISLTNRVHPVVKDGIKAWREEQSRLVRQALTSR
jgi:serine-type D-Ala-D-Ala carboxypeptidase